MAVGMPNLGEAVAKAVDRADAMGVDLDTLTRAVRNKSPDLLTSVQDRRERQKFLESLYDQPAEADTVFERIIAGNELQDANFLTRGALVARPVVRVVLKTGGGRIFGYGTGFLVGERVLITNNHVLPNSDVARASEIEAYYERGLMGEEIVPLRFALDPAALFETSKELDFSLVAVAPRDKDGRADLSTLGWLPLIGGTGKAVEGEWLTIIQHPKGERKQLCVRENQLLKRDTDVLWYSSDTLGGSSGSPVFNNDWLVVALHHSGVPKTVNGKWQTTSGRDYDPSRDGEDDIQWIANEGIRVSRIMETLRSDNRLAAHPLIAPILKLDVGGIDAHLPVQFTGGTLPARLFVGGVEVAPVVGNTPSAPALLPPPAGGPAPRTPSVRTPPKEASMSQHFVTVTLAVDEDGRVSIADGGSSESALVTEATTKKTSQVIDAPVDPETDWLDGYDPFFLGVGDPVQLPLLADDAPIAPLLDTSVYGQPAPDAATARKGVLHYNGYSVVMHATRKLAFFSAANINGGVEFPNLSRPTDNWLYDDRLSRDHQVGPAFYKNNKIDRGHLTRREDMEWGLDPVEATRRANGTCTWTNCSPQHKLFNQDKSPDPAIRLWGGLEKYILEQTARHYGFRVQCFTGPIFDTEDPVYRGVQIPLDFWKVVVAIDDQGRLFATGYILSQQAVLDVTDLDEAAIAQPFGAFQTYQRTLAEIEKATHLRFTYGDGHSLSDVDPLARELKKPAWRRRRTRRPGTDEAALVPEVAGTGDAPLTALEDILLF